MTTAKPQTIRLQRQNLPGDLTQRDQWNCWRWELRDGKWTKVPIDARTGRKADPSAPAEWHPFSVACYYLDQHPDNVDGIGFLFTPDDPYFGIDLDNARDPETGALTAAAQAIVDRFDTFTEWSIRGNGVHAIGIGELPGGKGRKRSDLGIEAYDRGRFFVVSGHVIINPNLIDDRSDELLAWHAELWPPKPEPQRVAPAVEPLSVTDDDLFQTCLGNEKFRRLHHDDDSDYADDTSSADLAYANIIVRNGGSAAQIDALYRQSSRYREKWDTKRGQTTYGAWTIARSLDGTIVPFTPGPRPTVKARLTAGPGVNPQDDGLLSDELPDDIAGLKAIIIDLRTRMVALEQRTEAAETRAAAAEERCAQISHVQSRTATIFRNKDIGQKRFTGIALINRFANRESAGDAGDERGLYKMPLKGVAGDLGASPGTISKHVQELEDAGLVRREVRWTPAKVDKSTGDIISPAHKETFIGLPEGTNVTDFVEALANLKPEKPSNWGGNRPHCPNHPTADVIRETTWRCTECNELVAPVETKVIRVNPQDDDLLDEDFAATGTDGPTSGTSHAPRGSVHISMFSTTSHNEQADSVAGRWMRGQPMPPPTDPGVPF